ncbi:ABC transporter permease [Gordonia polyisoprenivorans]|uniref:ABC transporter permease n=1 Tax=Gordonia TaxID=2053 RepID=UPI0003769684|nr:MULTISPECIES: ABC transporter permease [Gordonia]MDF3283253.1 ABC transporter permease [Gordonia sp. N1V]QUD84935.1 ABC transporter permease [Gordonia polyisoprenivorans]
MRQGNDEGVNDIGNAVVRIGPALGVVVVVLVVAAALVNYLGATGHARQVVIAAIRAAGQLAALAAVLAVVIGSLWASTLFVAVMATVAAATSAGRIVGRRTPIRAGVGNTLWCLLPVAVPTIVVVAGIVALGVLPATGLAIIPTAGIMFGGAMNTTSLAGRRAHDELTTRRGEVDAALSLGFVPREARMEISRSAAATALIPGIDQTRSVGLVTIPGAFVGMVLGGASVTTAAIMQLFVLISLLAVSAVAVVVTTELVARGIL